MSKYKASILAAVIDPDLKPFEVETRRAQPPTSAFVLMGPSQLRPNVLTTTPTETVVYLRSIDFEDNTEWTVSEFAALLGQGELSSSLAYPKSVAPPQSISKVHATGGPEEVGAWHPLMRQFLLPPKVYVLGSSSGIELYCHQRPIDVLVTLLLKQVYSHGDQAPAMNRSAQATYSRQHANLLQAAEGFLPELRDFLVKNDLAETTTMLLHILSESDELYFVPLAQLDGVDLR